jgi:hypothetical protein
MEAAKVQNNQVLSELRPWAALRNSCVGCGAYYENDRSMRNTGPPTPAPGKFQHWGAAKRSLVRRAASARAQTDATNASVGRRSDARGPGSKCSRARSAEKRSTSPTPCANFGDLAAPAPAGGVQTRCYPPKRSSLRRPHWRLDFNFTMPPGCPGLHLVRPPRQR